MSRPQSQIATIEIESTELGIHSRCGGQVVLLSTGKEGGRYCYSCGVKGPLVVLVSEEKREDASDFFISEEATVVNELQQAVQA